MGEELEWLVVEFLGDPPSLFLPDLEQEPGKTMYPLAFGALLADVFEHQLRAGPFG